LDVVAGEIMTPTSDHMVLMQSLIQSVRGVQDILTSHARLQETLNKSIDDIREQAKTREGMLGDVRDTVLKIEARDVESKVTELRSQLEKACGRIDTLEKVQDRSAGALSSGRWLLEHAPWILALLMGAFAFYTAKGHG
jgi:hypothetical protein